MAETETVYCARHPGVETSLLCGRCETPICPRCLYHTPVGARCRDCANVRRLPTYNISAAHLARAAAGALIAGAVLGGIWGVLLPFNVSFFFGLLAGLGLGYGVGEAVSVAANRKAGPPLQVIAACGVIVAYLVRSVILASALRNVEIADILTEDLFGYVVLLLGIFVAVGRVR
jgi:hypothetical protein